MLQINDTLDGVLLGCFFFGLVFTLVMLFVGDAGLGGEAVAGGEGDGLLPFNLSSLLAFVAWFGGVGYLARNAGGWPPALSLVVAVVGGLLGALAVARTVSTFVAPKGAVLDPADYRLPGTIARVTSSIRAGGVGEVVYEQAGVRQVSAARGAGGRAIPRGAEVVLLESSGGTAVVEPSEIFFADRGERPTPVAETVGVGSMHPKPD